MRTTAIRTSLLGIALGLGISLFARHVQAQAPTTVNDTVCLGSQATLTAAGSTAPGQDNYRWYRQAIGGQAITGVTGASYSFVPTATTTLYVALDDAGVESARTPVTVVVNRNPRGINNLGTAALYAYYPVNNGLADVSGNANPINTSGQGNTPDRFNTTGAGAASFTSATAGFVINRLLTSDSNSVFTHTAWVQTSDVNGGPIFSFGSAASAGSISTTADRILYLAADGSLRYRQGGDSIITSTSGLNDGRWHHYAVSRAANGTVAIYLDGFLLVEDSIAAPDSLGGYLRMLHDRLPGGSSRLLANIDELRFYNRALSSAEIQTVYHLNSISPVVNMPSITTTGTTACGVAVPTITVANSQAGVRYQMVNTATSTPFGPAVVSSGGNTLLTIAFSARATVRVVATDTTTGCSTELTTDVNITVNPVPTAPTSALPTYESCGPERFVINMRGAAQGDYRWYTTATGGLPFVTDSTFIVTLREGDSAVYYVAVVNSFGCQSTRTKVVARANAAAQIIAGPGSVSTFNLYARLLFDASYADNSGNARPTVVTNGTTLSFGPNRFGKPSSALVLTGQAGVVGVNTQIATPGPNQFTIGTWFRTSSTTGAKLIGYQGNINGTTGNYDRQIYMSNSGQLYFGVNSNGVVAVNTTATFNDGNWHHVAASLGLDSLKLYVDGNLVATNTTRTTGQSFAGFWIVGGGSTGGFPNTPNFNGFNGSLDDVHIYSRVLADAEIREMMMTNGVGITLVNQQQCGTVAPGELTLRGTQAGFTYQLRNANGQPVGNRVLSTGAPLTLFSSPIDTTASFRILALDTASGCSAELDTTITFFGGTKPAAPTSINQSSCGTGTLTMQASGATDGDYRWFSDSTSTTVLGVNASLVTPVINARDSIVYWVAIANAAGCFSDRVRVVARSFDLPANTGNSLVSRLRHRWDFTNGSTVDSRLANNGTLDAGAFLTADRRGVANNAIALDGTSAARMTTTTNQTNVGTNYPSWAMSVWFRTNTTSGGRIMGTGGSNTGNNTTQDRVLYLNNENRLSFFMRSAGPTITSGAAVSPTAVNDNNWHHAVAVFTNNVGMQLYLDGNLVATNTNIRTQQTGNFFWRIGADALNNVSGRPSSDFFNGSVDDARVYTRAITEREVLALYNDPSLTVTTSGLLLCGSGDVKIRVNNARSNNVYQLQANGSPVGTAISPVGDSVVFQTGVITTSTNYSILATNPVSNCTVTLDTLLSITVNPIPTVAGTNDTTRCGSGAVTFRAAGAVTGRYRWYAAETGGTSLANTPTLAGTITLGAGNSVDSLERWVSVISLAGCESPRVRVRARAFANPTGTTAVTASAPGACTGDSVTLTATGPYASYVWRMGTTIMGTTSGSFIARATGSYTATGLTAEGCAGPASPATALTFSAKPATPTITLVTAAPIRLTTAAVTNATYQWYLNGVLVTGATGSTLTNPSNGDYTVVVNLRGCLSDTSAVLNVVSLTNRIAGGILRVFPNPSRGDVTLDASGIPAEQATVVLTDLTGRTVHTEVVDVQNGAMRQALQLPSLAAGQYTLQVQAAGKMLVT